MGDHYFKEKVSCYTLNGGILVKDETKEIVLLKHYQNIQRLSRQQLDMLMKGNLADLNECIAQKQLMIDQIKIFQSEFDITDFSAVFIEKLRCLLTDIAATEAESQKLLSTCQNTVRLQLLASRQAKILRQAYEAPLSTGHFINRSK
jgi:hypothetical protein